MTVETELIAIRADIHKLLILIAEARGLDEDLQPIPEPEIPG